jgi:hypothetical protein
LIAGRSNREWEKDNSEYYNAQQQDYRNKNKNKKKNYDIEYRLNNADKIKKMTYCECGGKYQQKSKCYHLKTKKFLIKDKTVY